MRVYCLNETVRYKIWYRGGDEQARKEEKGTGEQHMV